MEKKKTRSLLDMINEIAKHKEEPLFYYWVRECLLQVKANRKNKPYGEFTVSCDNELANDLFYTKKAKYVPVIIWLPMDKIEEMVKENDRIRDAGLVS